MFSLKEIEDYLQGDLTEIYSKNQRKGILTLEGEEISDFHAEQIFYLRKEYVSSLFQYLWTIFPNSNIIFFRDGDQFQSCESYNYAFDEGDESVKKWLFHRGIPFQKKTIIANESIVFLTSWKLFIKYFGFFEWVIHEGLAFDIDLQWLLSWWHENDIACWKMTKFPDE